jgi:hypothetical protein
MSPNVKQFLNVFISIYFQLFYEKTNICLHIFLWFSGFKTVLTKTSFILVFA